MALEKNGVMIVNGMTVVKMMICAGAVALGAVQASAQDVATITLKTLDGKVVMTGELQGFADGYYSIVVAGIGLVSVAQDLVTCQSSSIDCAALVSST